MPSGPSSGRPEERHFLPGSQEGVCLLWVGEPMAAETKREPVAVVAPPVSAGVALRPWSSHEPGEAVPDAFHG